MERHLALVTRHGPRAGVYPAAYRDVCGNALMRGGPSWQTQLAFKGVAEGLARVQGADLKDI